MISINEYLRVVVLNVGYDCIENKRFRNITEYRNNKMNIKYDHYNEKESSVQIDFPNDNTLKKSAAITRYNENGLRRTVFKLSIGNNERKNIVNVNISDSDYIAISGNDVIMYLQYDNVDFILKKPGRFGEEKSDEQKINIEECSIERIISEIYKLVKNAYDMEDWKNSIDELFDVIRPALVLRIVEFKENWKKSIISNEKNSQKWIKDLDRRIEELKASRTFFQNKIEELKEARMCLEYMKQAENTNKTKEEILIKK